MNIKEIDEIAYVDKKEHKNTDNGGDRSTRETSMCFLSEKMQTKISQIKTIKIALKIIYINNNSAHKNGLN